MLNQKIVCYIKRRDILKYIVTNILALANVHQAPSISVHCKTTYWENAGTRNILCSILKSHVTLLKI